MNKLVTHVTDMPMIKRISIDSLKTDNIFCLSIDGRTIFVYSVFGTFLFQTEIDDTCRMFHAHIGKLYVVYQHEYMEADIAIYIISANCIKLEKTVTVGYFEEIYALTIDTLEKFVIVTSLMGITLHDLTDGSMIDIIDCQESFPCFAITHAGQTYIFATAQIYRVQLCAKETNKIGNICKCSRKAEIIQYLPAALSVEIAPSGNIFVRINWGKTFVFSQDGELKQSFEITLPTNCTDYCYLFSSNGTIVVFGLGLKGGFETSELLFYR
jgi:hypothetical protein